MGFPSRRANRTTTELVTQKSSRPTAHRSASTTPQRVEPKLRVGFLLTPRFTLVAFAGFVDALRLAADEGDRSRPRLCRWAVLGSEGAPVVSSCGASVMPTAPLESP